MKKTHTTHTIDVVFALVLFCVFTVSVLFVLMSGAVGYKNISASSQAEYEDRTCVAYINAKIKHYDNSENTISVVDTEGISALKLTEQIDGTTYNTLIYLYEGVIKELFFEDGTALTADQGQDIINATVLNFTMVSKNLLKITCSVDNENTSELFVNIKNGQEVEIK